MVSHMPDCQTGNRFRCMAGHHLTARGDIERLTSPSVHAGFGVKREMIGRHIIDYDVAMPTVTKFCDFLAGRDGGVAVGHQKSAVFQSPPIILRVSDLDT